MHYVYIPPQPYSLPSYALILVACRPFVVRFDHCTDIAVHANDGAGAGGLLGDASDKRAGERLRFLDWPLLRRAATLLNGTAHVLTPVKVIMMLFPHEDE